VKTISCFRKTLFVFLILFFNHFSFSQSINVVKGRVFDSSNKQPIPFANISVVGTKTGTVSDIDGNFVLKNINNSLQIQISYVGYENKIIKLSEQTSDFLNVYLKPQTITLPELTIKANDNPAHRIVRKVIENRERNNPEQLSSFKYVSYNKLVFTIDKKSVFYRRDTIRISPDKSAGLTPFVSTLRSDTSENMPMSLSSRIDSFFNKHYLFLSESVTRRSFLYPDKTKEIVLATRTSGIQQPYFIAMATQFQSFSFYNDMVNVFDKKYLNPLSKQAIGRYFYEIKDTVFSEEGDSIFVIFFRPMKNTLFDGLKGLIQINARQYAIQTIQAEPFKQDEQMWVGIQQIYRLVDGKQWFPYQLNTEIKMSGLQIGDKNDTLSLSDTTAIVIRKTVPLIGVGKSYIDSVQINPSLSKNMFNEVQVELKKNAPKQSDSLWMKYRAESFGETEKNTYHFIDSIGKEFHLDNKIRFMEILLNGYVPISFCNLNIRNLFAYNRFEGFRLNLDLITNEKISKYWAIGGYAGYGFKDKKWKYGGLFQLTPHPIKETKIILQYSNDVRESGEIAFFDQTSLIGSNAYRRLYIWNMDYFERYQASITFRTFRYFKNNLAYSRNSLLLSSFNFFLYNDSIYKSVRFEEYTFSSKFLYKEQFFQTLNRRFSIGSKYPVLWWNVHYGTIEENHSTYWKAEANLQIPVKWGIHGKSTFTIMGGYTHGRLPISLLYGGYSSYDKGLPIAIDHTFATMRMSEFYFDRFVFVFFKHDFGSILFHIGKFNPGLSLHQNIALGDLSEKNKIPTIKTANHPFLESGIQVYNLFKQSFNGLGIGVFYRYGYYSSPVIKENIALKAVVTVQFN